MGNLIDCEALKKAIEHFQYTEEFCIKHQIDSSISLSMLEKIIDNAQIIEPRICKLRVQEETNYCSNCGASMKGGDTCDK